MAIESKNLLVWVKAMSRGQALPLDASEIYASLAEAKNYASTSAIAYAGQTVKAMTADGKYHEYILQPSEAGYTLEEVGAIKQSDLKQYVMVVEALPESGMEQGILYICDTTGSIWTGSEWKEVFWDVTSDVDALGEKVEAVESALDDKAPIANPVFTGSVKIGEEEVAVKSYVDGLIANMVSSVPGIVDGTNALPSADYKAGQTFRVAEAGTYAGHDCEIGDLIIVLKDYVEGTASDADFMVVQANIDGAVTSSADAATVGEIVVFDAVTGKVVKGSGVNISSLNDAIAKAHEHANAEQLATYDKTQAELLAAAKAEAQSLVTAHETAVNTALDGKADKAATLAGYGITDAYTTTVIDGKLKTITDNLNTKISSTDVDTKIATAKTEILGEAATAASDTLELRVGDIGDGTVKEYVDGAKQEAIDSSATAASEALSARVGAIPADTTIKSYIDTAVGSGGTASAQAIATAKQEAIDTSKTYTDGQIATQKSYVDTQDETTLATAKGYTDSQITAVLTVTEF